MTQRLMPGAMGGRRPRHDLPGDGAMDDHVNVLIASANPATADAMKGTLLEAGHACTVADGAQRAIQEAGAGRYDIVVTGLPMGDEDGLGALRAARQGNPDCQVIVISDKANPLATHRVVVSLDGRPVEDFGGSRRFSGSSSSSRSNTDAASG